MSRGARGGGGERRAAGAAGRVAGGAILACWLLYFASIPLGDRTEQLGVCADLPGWMHAVVLIAGLFACGGLLLRWLRLEAREAGGGHFVSIGKDRTGGWIVLLIGLAVGLLPWSMAIEATVRYADMALDRGEPQAEALPARWQVIRRRGGPRCALLFEARGSPFSAPSSCDSQGRAAVRALVHPGALGVPWVEKGWSLR